MECRWLMESTIPILVLKKTESEWRFESANLAFMRLMDIKTNDIHNKTVDDIVSHHDQMAWLKRYENDSLALIELADDWYEVEVVFDGDNIVFIHHNLSAQVALDDEFKRLQMRIARIQKIASIGDWENNLVTHEEFWSDEIYKILGFRDKSIRPSAETFMRFVHPDDTEKVSQAHEGLADGEAYEIEYRIMTIDGQVRWIITRAKVEMDEAGVPKRFYGTLQDITERKRLQSQVKQAYNVAEDAYQTKSQFLAMMSHEVRTPINGILGMSELLKASPLTEEQSDYVEDIQFSADALMNVVEDILDMSKADRNVLTADSEAFDLHLLMRNIVRQYQLKASQSDVRFIHHIDPKIPRYVWGDGTKLQQILVNLLGNAFQYTDAGRIRLKVLVKWDDIETSELVFEVEDTGVGFDPSALSKVLGLFEKDSLEQSPLESGMGIGLSIVGQYTKLMNGSVSLESQETVGSKFTVQLAFEKAQLSYFDPEEGGLYANEKASHIHALVFEQGGLNHQYYESLLRRRCGFKLSFANTLDQVVRALDGHSISFLIVDAHMKDEMGLHIINVVRESLKWDGGRLPIISISSDIQNQIRSAHMTAGASYFIEKPIDESDLINIVHKVIDETSDDHSPVQAHGFQYIVADKLGHAVVQMGRDQLEDRLNALVQSKSEKVNKILLTVSPLNILALSHEIGEIDQAISNFGNEDIQGSLELIKAALLNDDTAGMDVIVADFMEEYESFVTEMERFITTMPQNR